jgi:hypothetical protein
MHCISPSSVILTLIQAKMAFSSTRAFSKGGTTLLVILLTTLGGVTVTANPLDTGLDLAARSDAAGCMPNPTCTSTAGPYTLNVSSDEVVQNIS